MLEDKDLLSIQEVRTKVEKAHTAWLQYRTYSQEQIDAIVERMAAAARANAKRLADMAVEETGYGNAKDKYVKNLLCADWLPRRMRGMKTVGVLRELPEEKVVEIGIPMGVVAAILPTTNPTSTAIYKVLISLKAGNAIVLSPHPRAHHCTCYTAGILYQAAVEAGAPEGIIQCVDNATLEATNALMRHERTGVILSTGGAGIVRAAYSSGKPAFGVGPGNVPVLIDTSADLKDAVAKVIAGKSFDYGTVCSSEQAIVAEASLRDRILSLLKANHACIASDAQKHVLGKLLIMPNWTVNPQCVGQSPAKIARMAGFEVPPDTSIICAELEGVGKQHPLSAEKLSPVLALYFVQDFNAALDTCFALLKFGGMGHTAVIYSNNDQHTREFAMRMPAMRVLVNTPAPQGSTGITTNVFPSMTLGCGAAAGNSTSDNVGPQHLINIKRLAYTVRQPEEAFEMPLDYNAAPGAPVGPPSSSPIGPIDRSTVAAAVERYLAARGIPVAAPAAGGPSCAPVAQPSRPVPVVSNIVAEVVDRFLARRGTPESKSGSGRRTSEAAPPQRESPPEPVDFVSEADVRSAIREKRKIYIGPKTIVTPSARDLAGPSDILVLAQDSPLTSSLADGKRRPVSGTLDPGALPRG
ncbi:MAG: aldehyde dehydrogenase family protein [Bryobacteraceae bacterium]|jgi:acetaldehyde dehydrogenase (acetylating)